MCLSVSGQADSPGLQENDASLRGRGQGEVEEYCESFGQNRFIPEDSTDSASKVSSAGVWGILSGRWGQIRVKLGGERVVMTLKKREGMLMH